MTEVGAFVAWLGAMLIVLSDGRRGLALGLAVTTVALAVVAWIGSGDVGAALALLVGGGVAAVQRLRAGLEGWEMMPAGSTSRLLLSIAGGLLALWIATSVMTGTGAPQRFAALSVIGLMGARVLTTDEPAAVLTALATLALAVAAAAALADSGAGLPIYIAGAILAIGVSVIPVRVPDGA